ncbi:MAG: sialidase [Candidatus Aminicenantaceae bacterium]
MFFKNIYRKQFLLRIALLILFIFAGFVALSYSQQLSPEIYKEFKHRHIGPIGNRTIAVVGVPGNPNVYYIGTASGGIWKSIDGGIHWKPIFDDQPVSSIGSLAIAPSDSNIVWAGTGETFIRSNISQGIGIYKSTDAGKTWQNMGLEKTGRIGRVIIHPKNPNIVFAAAMGHCYGPQQERGIFRTLDGGKTWERVLFVDENTGCSDIAMDPNNPRILFAGMWQMLIRTWGRWSGGPGSGLYMSKDGGTTWKHLTGNGLPETEMGKIAVAVAPSNSERVYALIETEDEGLWRSDDGGETWKHVNHDHMLLNRPLYYTRCTIATDDHNEIYTIAGTMGKSLDGGENFKRVTNMVGGDNHDMWIDPLIPDRMVVGNDQFVSVSTNRGETWHGVSLPIAQMYHVYVDNQIPYYVYGNRQDGPSFRGPSNSLFGKRGIPSGLWHSVGGSESGFAIPDPMDNNIVWSGNFEGLDRFDLRTGHSRAVDVWPINNYGYAASTAKYRWQWTFPIAISPHDHNKVYVGSQYVHQTTNGGESWEVISPDLTTNDKSKQQLTGGITQDDTQPTYCCVIFAIAESPVEQGLIWTGSNDGLVHVTRDGGSNWTNVTKNFPDLPPWGTVSNLEPSRFEAGTCYITIDFHQVNIRDPHVYKTTDYGKSWTSISSDIPKSELSYAHCVREDPVRKGLLYLGTENALYVSFNDGKNWIPLQNNLPHAPVHWLTIQEHFNDLVIGTYGRGFWILDDITPLQQLTPEVVKADVYLFAPRPAYRFLFKAPHVVDPRDQCRGENPPYGASLNYYLKTDSKDEVKISILDEKGQKIRSLKGTKKQGIHRIWWDLRYEPSTELKLRTSPVGHPHVVVGPKGWRPYLDGGDNRGPKVIPGTYVVKLTVGVKEFTQKLVVKKDPHSVGSIEDIKAQVKVLLEIHDNRNSVAKMINKIEWIRKQIYDLQEVLEGDKNAEQILNKSKELDKKFIALEDSFIPLGYTGRYDRDGLRWPDKLLDIPSSLASGIAQTDFALTTQQKEAHEELSSQLPSYIDEYNELISKDLNDFNKLLKESNIANIVVAKVTDK